MPDITPKTLAEGASTSLYAALDPGLRGKSPCQWLSSYIKNFDNLVQQITQAPSLIIPPS